MATDRLSDSNLARATKLKRLGTASSCNAFAIATFSSYLWKTTSIRCLLAPEVQELFDTFHNAASDSYVGGLWTGRYLRFCNFVLAQETL